MTLATPTASILRTMEGSYYEPITDDLKERFLALIEGGLTRPEAAAKLEQTGTRFKRICNPASAHYDADFAASYDELTKPGGEHRENLLERLQVAAIERGIHSSDRLLEKLLMIRDPEWEPLRPQNFKVQVSVEQLAILLPGLSNETLDSVITELESRRPELMPGPPVIEL